MGSAPGSSSKTNRIVSESTLTESDAETRKPAKKGARPRRNSNVSNATKSERSGERQDARSVSQTPVPTLGTGIKAIFAGHKNPLQPVERDGMLCWRGHTKRVGVGISFEHFKTTDNPSLQLNRVSWNPLNLSRLISCSQDGFCNIWDFADPPSPDDKQLRLLTRVPIELTHKALETKKAVVDLAWNNDGNAFVTSTSRPLSSCRRPADPFVSPTLSVDKDNVARSFVGDGELQGTGYRHEREITCVAWNPNGNYFATTNIDGQTCVWDISVVPIKLKNSWDHHAPNKAYHVDWLTNEIFATCSEDDTVAICSVNSPTTLKLLTKHKDRVLVCKFSPKARPEDKLPTGSDLPTGMRRLLASGSDDHTVRIWDVQALEDEGARVFADPRDAAVCVERRASDHECRADYLFPSGLTETTKGTPRPRRTCRRYPVDSVVPSYPKGWEALARYVSMHTECLRIHMLTHIHAALTACPWQTHNPTLPIDTSSRCTTSTLRTARTACIPSPNTKKRSGLSSSRPKAICL